METFSFRDIIMKHMRRIRQWSVFVAVLGYIWIAAALFIAMSYLGVNDGLAVFGGIDVTDLILAVALANVVLLSFPTLYLTLFAKNLKRFELSDDGDDLEHALFYLRRYVSFIGIVIIAVLVVFFLWQVDVLNFAFLF